MSNQSKVGGFLQKATSGKFDVAGVPLGDIVSTIASVVKRKPNVKAWAQEKRKYKRSLKQRGLSGAELRSSVATWRQQNPKPQGNNPYDPSNLGVSNQMNPNSQAIITDAGFPGLNGSLKKSGLGFSPWFLLLGIPFLFPKQFKKLTSKIKI